MSEMHDGYQRGNTMVIKRVLLKWFINFVIKKTSGSGIENENMTNQRVLDLATGELAEELHKPVIRKFEKKQLNSPFIDNIWSAELADMQLISKFNKGIRFLICVIDTLNKYAWLFL